MAFHPVLPHGLVSHRENGDLNFGNKVFGNNTLKMGVVVEIIEEDSKDNIVKLGPEYHVMAIEQDKDNGSNTSIYKNCMAIDSFGGVSDFFQMKYRVPKDMAKVKNSGSVKNQTGSIVLLLCLDGNAEKAVIIGSIAHPGRKTSLTKEAGHHMEGEFNGVNWKVNKDGELTITYRSKTDGEGKPADEEAGGTFVKVDKTGSVDINTGEDKNYIRIDKPNSDIGLQADENIGLTTKNKNIGFNSGNNLSMNIKKDLLIMAEGKADITVKSMIDVKTDGDLGVKAKNYKLTLDNSMVMKMNSFIMQAETAVLNNQQTIIGPSPQPAVILNTITLSIGNLGAPSIGFHIGPFSSTVLISS